MTGCGVGQPDHICGQPAVGAIASLSRTTMMSAGARFSVTPLCVRHYNHAPADWDPPEGRCAPEGAPRRCSAMTPCVAHRPKEDWMWVARTAPEDSP